MDRSHQSHAQKAERLRRTSSPFLSHLVFQCVEVNNKKPFITATAGIFLDEAIEVHLRDTSNRLMVSEPVSDPLESEAPIGQWSQQSISIHKAIAR